MTGHDKGMDLPQGIAGGRVVIHVRNDSADGRAVEQAQREMRAWHDAGFAVAPVPADDRPHPYDTACPSCSPSWRRVADEEHPRWEIVVGGGMHTVTDVLINTYGRKHIERVLDKLPPLPPEAWLADRRTVELTQGDLDSLNRHSVDLAVAGKWQITGRDMGSGRKVEITTDAALLEPAVAALMDGTPARKLSVPAADVQEMPR